MKKSLLTRLLFLLTIAFPLAVSLLGAAGPASHAEKMIPWTTNYNEALAKSKQEGKPVLLFFTGSDWCGWCHQLEKEVLGTANFADLAKDRYIFVEVDFPKKKPLSPQLAEQNKFLGKKYRINSYPTIVIADSSGNPLGETGYKSGGAEKYAAYLESIVAPHLAKFKTPVLEGSTAKVDVQEANITEMVATRGEPETSTFDLVTTVEKAEIAPTEVVAQEAQAIDEPVASIATESIQESVAAEAEVQPY